MPVLTGSMYATPVAFEVFGVHWGCKRVLGALLLVHTYVLKVTVSNGMICRQRSLLNLHFDDCIRGILTVIPYNNRLSYKRSAPRGEHSTGIEL